MHDLAPVAISLSSEIDWESAALPARLLTGTIAYRLKTARPATALSATLGLPEAGQVAVYPNFEAIWLGPGEWLLIAPQAGESALARWIDEALTDRGGAAVPAGDGLAMIALENKSNLFSRLTGLRAETFAPGRTARTRIADTAVVFVGGVTGVVRLIFDRAQAHHIRRWLDCAT
jgi:heterotetrameric sarcosine oxidase gamma subunit